MKMTACTLSSSNSKQTKKKTIIFSQLIKKLRSLRDLIKVRVFYLYSRCTMLENQQFMI